MFKKRIYLDYASLTPIDKRVLKEIEKFSGAAYANPSSLYVEGMNAKKALAGARERVAKVIGAHTDEIVFTGGGTEANNLAIMGAVEHLRNQGLEYEKMRIAVSAIEHSSVRECANRLNDKGVSIDVIPVNGGGQVILEELKKLIRPETVVVSVMAVNNETGAKQPLREIIKIVRQARQAGGESKQAPASTFGFQSFAYPIFHTDAAQAACEDLNMEKLGVDLVTLDGSKIYGPRGVGALFVRRGVPLSSIIAGGGQERGLRSGTENIPGIMGFAKALELAATEREEENARLAYLKEFLIDGLKAIRPEIVVNGNDCSPRILNISIPGIDNEFFILELDARGVACSTKSSCLRDEDESFVLKAMGADSKTAIRFSFGRWTSKGDIRKALRLIESVLICNQS